MLHFENKNIVHDIYVVLSCHSDFTKFSSYTRLPLCDAAWARSERWTNLGLPAFCYRHVRSITVWTVSRCSKKTED